MSTRIPRLLAHLAILALVAGACGSSSEPTTAPEVETAPVVESSTTTTLDDPAPAGDVISRFLADGYSGRAWPVPTMPTPGEHVNAVAAEVLDDGPAGETVWLPAGTPVQVVDVSGGDATVALADGRTARAPADDLWIIGEFVDFKYIEVDGWGSVRPIADTDLRYHRVNVNNFDDRETEEFEGIANNIRRFLRCEADEWKIANQYFAIDIVADGIYQQDAELVEKGVLSLNWGIEQDLAEDGVFSLYRACDDTTHRDFSETHHSTQWFAALGRGVFQLAASRWAGEYRAEIEAYVDHLETLATYLTTDAVRDHWRERWLFEENGDVFTHKFYMRAAGLSFASALTDDPADAARWSREAREISEEGMAQQWDNGVNPERGGFDVRYQMYGTWLGIVYRATLAEGEHRDALTDTIDAAIAWIIPKLDPDTGAIDFEGSTRSCTPRSNVNEYHPYHMLSAFLLWAHTEPGNDHLYELSLLANQGQRSGQNTCPEAAEA